MKTHSTRSGVGNVKIEPYSPNTPVANIPTPSQRSVSHDEFEDLIKTIKYGRITLYSIAEELFSLSVGTVDIKYTLNRILAYRRIAMTNPPVPVEFRNCLSTSESCPPDTTLLLLTIPAKQLLEGQTLEKNYIKELLKKAVSLRQKSKMYATFQANPHKPGEILETTIKIYLWALGKGSKEGLVIDNEIDTIWDALMDSDTPSFKEFRPSIQDAGGFSSPIREPNQSIYSESIFTSDGFHSLGISDAQHSPLKLKLNFDSDLEICGSYSLDKPKNQQLSEDILELKQYFEDWDRAYEGVVHLWGVLKSHPDFDVGLLLDELTFSFADYIIKGLTALAEEEGVELPLDLSTISV